MSNVLIADSVPKDNYRLIKTRLHSRLLEEIDLEGLNRLADDIARERVRQAIRDMLNREKTPLTLPEREQLVVEIVDELFGYGPIEALLADPTVSDILINGARNVYVERR